jgi:hypothetical protein
MVMQFLSGECRQPSCFLELRWPWNLDAGFFKPPKDKAAKKKVGLKIEHVGSGVSLLLFKIHAQCCQISW